MMDDDRRDAQHEAAILEAREGIDALLRGTAEHGRDGYQEYRGIRIGEHWVAEWPDEADYAITLLARLADGQDVRPQIEQYVERARAYLVSLVDTDKIAAEYERRYRDSVDESRIEAWHARIVHDLVHDRLGTMSTISLDCATFSGAQPGARGPWAAPCVRGTGTTAQVMRAHVNDPHRR